MYSYFPWDSRNTIKKLQIDNWIKRFIQLNFINTFLRMWSPYISQIINLNVSGGLNKSFNSVPESPSAVNIFFEENYTCVSSLYQKIIVFFYSPTSGNIWYLPYIWSIKEKSTIVMPTQYLVIELINCPDLTLGSVYKFNIRKAIIFIHIFNCSYKQTMVCA